MDKIYKYEPLWGDWLIDEKIGEGSFGKVYRIRRENNGNIYFAAVKIITIPQNVSEITSLASEGMDEKSISAYFKEVLDGLIEEIDLLYSFRGLSNIVNIDDYKVITNEDNISYDILIKMELLQDIGSYIQFHPLRKVEVLKFAIDMCKALEACHKKNIIHRDIKPDNIFISSHGDFKLGDFGVARKMEKTLSGLSKKGTYLYMAPEVFKGEDYSKTVDIYSLGIVLYRYLNYGKLPFLLSNQVLYRQREEALARRMRGDVMPFPESGQGEFESIVMKAINYDSKDRYQNIFEFKEALERVNLSSFELDQVTTSFQKNLEYQKTDVISNLSDSEIKYEKFENPYRTTEENEDSSNVDDLDSTQLIDQEIFQSIDRTLIIKDDSNNSFSIDLNTFENVKDKKSIVNIYKKKAKNDNYKTSETRPKASFKMSGKQLQAVFWVLAIVTSVVFIVNNSIFTNFWKYNAAQKYFIDQNFEEAASVFKTLGDYRDSIEMANESYYLKGMNQFNVKDYLNASNTFQLLSVKNYKDSEQMRNESIYRLAMEYYIQDSGSQYAKDNFNKIHSYKDSEIYSLLIEDKQYESYYTKCLNENDWFVYWSDHVNMLCNSESTGVGVGDDLSFNVLELYEQLVSRDMNQSLEERYIFAKMRGLWETSDKKFKMDISFDDLQLIYKLSGFKFSGSFQSQSERRLVEYELITDVIRLRGDQFIVYPNIYDSGYINYASIEFIDNTTMRFSIKKSGSVYIFKKVDSY